MTVNLLPASVPRHCHWHKQRTGCSQTNLVPAQHMTCHLMLHLSHLLPWEPCLPTALTVAFRQRSRDMSRQNKWYLVFHLENGSIMTTLKLSLRLLQLSGQASWAHTMSDQLGIGLTRAKLLGWDFWFWWICNNQTVSILLDDHCQVSSLSMESNEMVCKMHKKCLH